MTMEQENGFLSNTNFSESEKARMPKILRQILDDLNMERISTIIEDTTTMHLKVIKVAGDPPLIEDHHVPIFLMDQFSYNDQQWDLTTQQVIPFINGFNHVAKIAAEANVENNLVKACIQNLLYYGTVKLIPIFQYSNIYAGTPELKNLTEKKAFQKECLEYVSKTSETLASFRDVFVFYCNMTHGTTLRDLCARFNPHFIHIDERKLVQFGLLHKLIRRIHKFPVCVGSSARSSPLPFLHQTFNGQSSYDEICCKMGISSRQLAEQIEDDPRILVIRK
uniref:Nitrogen permease regulator 2-like protein n=2 Tax=Timema douglasi TaxID=61478 RepID=A0A7R8ZBH6_TIMDO|nr:unnamed protein product [Timema douglasi]